MNKPRIFYIGVTYTKYTPAVEGQMLRDCLTLLANARHQYSEVVVVGLDKQPERMLSGLGLTLLVKPELAKDWIAYRTEEHWPEEVENTRTLIQRDLYVPKADPKMVVLDDARNNGYYLPPQGRLAPDSISLLRPAPNGYIPVDPALLMIWGN
jgi:hypothetical protein